MYIARVLYTDEHMIPHNTSPRARTAFASSATLVIPCHGLFEPKPSTTNVTDCL